MNRKVKAENAFSKSQQISERSALCVHGSLIHRELLQMLWCYEKDIWKKKRALFSLAFAVRVDTVTG